MKTLWILGFSSQVGIEPSTYDSTMDFLAAKLCLTPTGDSAYKWAA